MKQKILLPHSGSSSRKIGFSAVGGTPSINDSHVMRSVNPFNMNQTTTASDKFRAMKLIGLMSSTVVNMGSFFYYAAIDANYQLAIYSEAGLILGKTPVTVFPGGNHKECQVDLETPVSIVKSQQYWLGLYLIGSIEIPYQVGFANEGAVFPTEMHSVYDSAPGALPVDISTIPGTSQKFSIWAGCKS